MVDQTDLFIDGFGIVMTLVSPIAPETEIIGGFVEGAGALKGGIEAINGQPKGAIRYGSLKTISTIADVGFDGARIYPGLGVVFNIGSIGMNVLPAVHWDKIYVETSIQ